MRVLVAERYGRGRRYSLFSNAYDAFGAVADRERSEVTDTVSGSGARMVQVSSIDVSLSAAETRQTIVADDWTRRCDVKRTRFTVCQWQTTSHV